MQLDLSDKTVLVTGASRGIGHSIARQMAEAGASVAAHFVRSSDRVGRLVAQSGGRVVPFQADLARPSECL
ncbi:MAG: SDR family NAD(P)-dependent oxidoreductase, partial [Rhodothermales bacterium]